jgi:hypothetical protein
MSTHEQFSKERRPKPYPAEKARQGEIVLRTPWQRWIFIGALVACVLLVIAFRLVALWS